MPQVKNIQKAHDGVAFVIYI